MFYTLFCLVVSFNRDEEKFDARRTTKQAPKV